MTHSVYQFSLAAKDYERLMTHFEEQDDQHESLSRKLDSALALTFVLDHATHLDVIPEEIYQGYFHALHDLLSTLRAIQRTLHEQCLQLRFQLNRYTQLYPFNESNESS